MNSPTSTPRPLEPARLWDDAAPWLGAAAVVIVPSLAETFGLVALEAMSHGTPVIAHDVGDLPRLIGDDGVLVPAGHGSTDCGAPHDGCWATRYATGACHGPRTTSRRTIGPPTSLTNS